MDKLDLEYEDDYQLSDSDEEYTQREKNLLKKVQKGRKNEAESSDEEEVMKFESDEEEDESEPERFVADSDLESAHGDDNLPDSREWGGKKSMYYNTDFQDNDYNTYNEKEEELAMLEQQEALAIQKRLAGELTDADFNLEMFATPDQHPEDLKVKKLKTDLSEMTLKQKLALLRTDSPEFEGLVKDFNDKITESKDLLVPALEILKSIDFPNHPFIEFIQCRNDLILSYCTNISFYLMLKAKRTKITNHPVVKRLVQFRELVSKLDDIFEYVIKPQLEVILAEMKDDEKIKPNATKLKMLEDLKSKVEESMEMNDESDDGAEKFEKPLFNQDSGSDSDEEKVENEGDEVQPGGTKRQITRQIAKNKGLTATKRRELRNPRVKNRLKFTKAVKRRKGAVQPLRSKAELYGGEATGIKTHLKRSVKIK